MCRNSSASDTTTATKARANPDNALIVTVYAYAYCMVRSLPGSVGGTGVPRKASVLTPVSPTTARTLDWCPNKVRYS